MTNAITGKKSTAAKSKSKENIPPAKKRPTPAKKESQSSNPSPDELLKQYRKELAEQKKLLVRQNKEIENLKNLLAEEKNLTSQQYEDIECLENEINKLTERILIINSENW